MESDPDPLRAIARRLFPLVRRQIEWWREAVRGWASNPPRHYVGAPSINGPELREDLRRRSRQQARRGEGESADHWNRRRAAIAHRREKAKQRLAKLQGLEDGCEILDDDHFVILPIPFHDLKTTQDERVALLAAIHDTYATADARIGPWPDVLELPSKAEIDMAMRWGGLLNRVSKLLPQHWETHEAAIEKFVEDVEQQFAPQGEQVGVQPIESPSVGFFPVNIPRVCESLNSLAGDIEFIASGRADERRNHEAWEHRTNGGRQLTRLRAALNNGNLDLADCDPATLDVLRNVWAELKRLRYGSHHDQPDQYRGPLFLPSEIGPLSEGLPIRKADEPYDPYPELTARVSSSAVDDAQAKLTGDDPTTKLASRALQRLHEPELTTKREQWSDLPGRLRKLAAKLVKPKDEQNGQGENLDANKQSIDKPQWNADTGKLIFRDKEIRAVSGQAKNVRSVLAAFQELAWPARIDDPLGGGKNQARVNDTVKTLNEGLSAIRFRADGSGAGYRWEPTD